MGMSEKPILFNGEMVRAILDGKKTQTRRVIKPQPGKWAFHRNEVVAINTGLDLNVSEDEDGDYWVKSKYGIPGDLLWVRETFLVDKMPGFEDYEGHVHYRANNIPNITKSWDGQWKPSIHMPKKYARIWLKVLDVKVERVQDIDYFGIYAEGIRPAAKNPPLLPSDNDWRNAFINLWDSIKEKRGYG